MVKLKFNTESTDVTSKSFKKKEIEEISLNPFSYSFEKGLEEDSLWSKVTKQEPPPVKKSLITLSSTNDLIGMEGTVFKIKEWYKESLQSITTKFLLLVGPVGCGKSELVRLLCLEESIKLFEVDITQNKPKADIKESIETFCTFKEIFENKQSKKLILFDNFLNNINDTISTSDIQYYYELRSNSSKKTKKRITIPPILIISGDPKGSKLSELKKTHEVHYINEIPLYVLKPWIEKIIKNYDMQFDNSVVECLMNNCKSDKRLIINTLVFLRFKYNDVTCTTSQVKNIIDSIYKNNEINIYSFVEQNLHTSDQIDLGSIFKAYENDSFLLTSLVQENYVDYSSDIEQIANAAESLSLSDTFHTSMYECNKTFVPYLHCVSSLCYPIYYSKSDIKTVKGPLRTSIYNNRYNVYLNSMKYIEKVQVGLPHYCKINYELIYFIKSNTKFLQNIKKITVHEQEFVRSVLFYLGGNEDSINKIEIVYKNFNLLLTENETVKTKAFGIKIKEKLNNIIKGK